MIDDQFIDFEQITSTLNPDGIMKNGVEVKVQYGTGWRMKNRKMFIEGVDLGTVTEWVNIADGSYRKTEEGQKLSDERWLDKQEKNPIIIK